MPSDELDNTPRANFAHRRFERPQFLEYRPERDPTAQHEVLPARRRISLGLGSIRRPGRPAQLFLEKAAGIGRRIQEQHATCFSAGVLPGVWDAAWQKRAGPRPADRDLISDLKGDFAAQHVRQLVAIAVKMECRLGAGRRGFFEQHDAVTGIAA